MTKRIAMLAAMAMAFPAAAGNLAPEVQSALATLPAGSRLTVVVHLKARADLSAIQGDRATRLRATIEALQAKAGATQGPVRTWLQARLGTGGVADFTPLWVVNGFSVTATAPIIRLLAALPAVDVVNLDAIAVVETGTPPSGPPEANVAITRAGDLWALGFTGEGVVVATLDSGADASHPDLAPRWRSGAGGWFDPYGAAPDAVRRLRPWHLDPGRHRRRGRGRDDHRRRPWRDVDRREDLQRRRIGHRDRHPQGVPVGARPRRRPGHGRRARHRQQLLVLRGPGLQPRLPARLPGAPGGRHPAGRSLRATSAPVRTRA